jgi:truncated hemoglobin YjbI
VADDKTLFDELGGEPALRAIIDDFVGRIFGDMMIGFFFRSSDRRRIAELEYQHAAEHLGGPVKYRGKPLAQAHGPHRIMGGQFNRRREILRRTLADHHAPERVVAAWLAHNDSLRGEITGDRSDECIG